MKLSKIQQIIKEEVAKAVNEIDHNREIERKFEKAVGIEPRVGGPENKLRSEKIKDIVQKLISGEGKIDRWDVLSNYKSIKQELDSLDIDQDIYDNAINNLNLLKDSAKSSL